MNRVIWLLHRHQARAVVVVFVVAAVVIVVTGRHMAHTYNVALQACTASSSCATLSGTLFRGDGLIIDLVALSSLTLPGLLGLFWGVPLVAKEMEEGTNVLAWTQSVTRRWWIVANLGWLVLISASLGAVMSALVSWWRIPMNALFGRLGNFDIQGAVPIAYCVFAVSLGVAAGVLWKRVLPAIATMLGVLVTIRAAIGIYLRPHYLAPLTKTAPLAQPDRLLPTHAWALSEHVVNAAGTIVDPTLPGGIPAACRSVPFGGQMPCVVAHGYHALLVYQPDSRFWTFQLIESAIFLVLAVPLVLITYRAVVRRDA